MMVLLTTYKFFDKYGYFVVVFSITKGNLIVRIINFVTASHSKNIQIINTISMHVCWKIFIIVDIA